MSLARVNRIGEPAPRRSGFPDSSIAGLVALGLALLIPAILRSPSLFEPYWYGDEGIFAAIASQLLAGDTLYVDIWDHKPPLIFVLYASVIAGFGESLFWLRLAAMGAVVATQLLLFAGTVILSGPRMAWLPAALYGLLMALPMMEGQLALTEVFMAALTTAGMVTYLRVQRGGSSVALTHLLLVGLLFGLASSFKPVALFDAGALAVFLLVHSQQTLRSLLSFSAGCALPWLVFAFLFAVNGDLAAFLDANVVYQLGYVQRDSVSMPALFILVGVPLVVSVFTWAMRGKTASSPLLVSWLGFAIAGASLGAASYPHYLLQILPPLVFLTGGALAGSRAGHAMAAFLLIVLVSQLHFAFRFPTNDHLKSTIDYYAAAVESFQSQDEGAFREQFHFGDTEELVKLLTTKLEKRPDSEVLIWGAKPWAYVLTDATPLTRFVVWYHPFGSDAGRQEVLDALDSSPGALVVIERGVPIFPGLEELLSQAYACVQYGTYELCARNEHGPIAPELAQTL